MQPFIRFSFGIIVVTSLSFISCSENDIIEELSEDSYTISRSRAPNDSITLKFPHKDIIIGNIEVQNAMDNAWQYMLMLVNPYNYRHEVGFYIYYNHLTKKIWVGDLEVGPGVNYYTMEPATLCLGPAKNNLEVCAFFHCHTPWYNIDPLSYRPTGYSSADINFAYENDLPGFVYDYPSKEINSQYPYDDVGPICTHFGPDQREPLNLQNNPYL